MKRRKYDIVYPDVIRSHLSAIDKKYWPEIRRAIEEQLSDEPDKETRNRKPLSKPSADDRWELRFGPQNSFRVFYQIDYPNMRVLILAVGFKVKEKLYIGRKEIKL